MLIMSARLLAVALITMACVSTSRVFAQEARCATPKPFNGYWGGGQLQVREHLMGIPILATARFSYRQIRYSPCAGGVPVLPPGVGEGGISLGIPLIDNRRGGWLLQMGARGQGSQRPGEPLSGLITGAPTTAGHLNIWETLLPLIQLSGAASAAIVPQSPDVPLSIAYVGGARIYAKHTQANFGMMVGGANAVVNIVPSLALRMSDSQGVVCIRAKGSQQTMVVLYLQQSGFKLHHFSSGKRESWTIGRDFGRYERRSGRPRLSTVGKPKCRQPTPPTP